MASVEQWIKNLLRAFFDAHAFSFRSSEYSPLLLLNIFSSRRDLDNPILRQYHIFQAFLFRSPGKTSFDPDLLLVWFLHDFLCFYCWPSFWMERPQNDFPSP